MDYNFKTCKKCGGLIEKQIEIFGRPMIVPVLCECAKEKRDKDAAEQQNRERQARLDQIIKNSLMDKEFREKTFENWDPTKGNEKMYKVGMRYSQNFKEMKAKKMGLLIYGQPGNGKTYTSAAIANNLISKYTPTICVSINSLLDRIKLNYNRWGNEGEDTIINSLANADLVVIDDLGTEQLTEWSISRIYNIIDSRYRNGLPLIITTNVTLQELEEKYGKRTYDRILEMCIPVLNEGKSIRKDAAREKTKIFKELLEG